MLVPNSTTVRFSYLKWSPYTGDFLYFCGRNNLQQRRKSGIKLGRTETAYASWVISYSIDEITKKYFIARVRIFW